MKHWMRAPSPALVISLIALFVALGGTSLGASHVIAKRHTDAKADTKLVNKLAPTLSVKHAMTADGATTAASATHATSADDATNATQATSALNATNASQLGGIQASSYLSGYQQVTGTSTPVDTTQVKFAPVSCPAGTKLIALGVQSVTVTGTLPAIIPQYSSETDGIIIAQKYDGQAFGVTPEAVCAKG